MLSPHCAGCKYHVHEVQLCKVNICAVVRSELRGMGAGALVPVGDLKATAPEKEEKAS
jgi:hypothetical protein